MSACAYMCIFVCMLLQRTHFIIAGSCSFNYGKPKLRSGLKLSNCVVVKPTFVNLKIYLSDDKRFLNTP